MISIEIILSLVALVFSGISGVFIALPYRNSLKPRLRIEIKDRDKKEVQSCLEWKNLFLNITNISKNSAENIKIKLISKLEVKETGYKKNLISNEEVAYLHPGEISPFPLKSISHMLEEVKDLFEIRKNKNYEMKVPKKNLTINLRVEVSSTGYKTYDDFYIEWYSMNSSPNWDAPRILCWNKRKDKYIIKMEGKNGN
ncbi:MAG: hypothetical protein KKB62_01805 [Nanoarchaeota archaeon]|nr:hypothetical protein [Nanoarchaeota archaeon]